MTRRPVFTLGACGAIAASTLAVCLLPSPTHGQEVWSTCEAGRKAPMVDDLAREIAPVLWLSPDEPLLGPSRRIEGAVIPAPLPPPGMDPSAPVGDKTVYYRVSQIRLREPFMAEHKQRYEWLPGVSGVKLELEHLYSLRFRFLLYYSDDIGFGEHQHDLEALELTLRVHQVAWSGGLCQTVVLARAVGAAHGSDWYTNTLELQEHDVDDVILPMHVLVEEGKHASAPDRNADGWFSPGYDSTRNTNDAWGVRDTLRNHRLGAATYRMENAKDRAAHKVVVVPRHLTRLRKGTVPADGRTNTFTGCSAYEAPEVVQNVAREPLLPRPRQCDEYHLVEAAAPKTVTAEYCTQTSDVIPLPHVQRHLAQFLDKWGFCARTSVKGPRGLGSLLADNVFAGPEGPGNRTKKDRLTYGLATQGGNGMSSTARGFVIAGGFGLRFPLTDAWLLPRASVLWDGGQRRYSLDALYTPSGARIVDWYAAVGADRVEGTVDPAEEVGIKLRFSSLGFPYNSLLGIRVGYRGALHRDLGGGRWILEVGFGGW